MNEGDKPEALGPCPLCGRLMFKLKFDSKKKSNAITKVK